jgi:uncharacterized protein YndB with AHSA1/START domain
VTKPTSALSLDVDQLIDARPDTVFRLLTEPDLYARWFGPEGATTTVEEMELTLGGRLELKIVFPEVDFEVRIEGFYEVIEPPLRLVHTWRSIGEELVTTVAFDIEPQGNRTRLRVHHRGFVDPVDLEQNQGGWTEHLSTLGELAAVLERTEA